MTTSPPWHQMPATLPINGVCYWVCQYRWFSTPFLAVYDEDAEAWQPVDLVLPIPWHVAPWYRIQ